MTAGFVYLANFSNISAKIIFHQEKNVFLYFPNCKKKTSFFKTKIVSYNFFIIKHTYCLNYKNEAFRN